MHRLSMDSDRRARSPESDYRNTDLQRCNVIGLRAFLTLSYFKSNLLAFEKGTTTSAINSTEMNKDIGTAFTFDKAEAFLVVEPLYCAGNSLT